MKKYLFLIVFWVALLGAAEGQNLVHNPSFEEYTNCPTGDNQLFYCIDWDKLGINNTPDYYNSCSLYFSTPRNNAGYQIPYFGNSYCGFYTSYWANPPYREYIGQKLNITLDSGAKYFVSFYISLANNMTCGTNKIGMLFSTKPYYYDGIFLQNFNNYAQIYSNVIIKDTLNWVKIDGSFIADSSYEYIGIGNFFDNNNTLQSIIDTSYNYCQSYYYLDNICISKDSLTCNTPVSINEINENESILIFPNPAADKITISLQNPSKTAHLSVYNILGKEIIRKTFSGNKTQVDVSGLAKGLYLLKVENEEGVVVKRFVKE